MKKNLILLSALSLFLVACGGDSGSNGAEDDGNSVLLVESLDDLPNCSKSREGLIAEIGKKKEAYICENGRWEYDHDILDSVNSEDDLTNCVLRNEGDSVWVVEESAVFVCTDRRWEKSKGNTGKKITSSSSGDTDSKLESSSSGALSAGSSGVSGESSESGSSNAASSVASNGSSGNSSGGTGDGGSSGSSVKSSGSVVTSSASGQNNQPSNTFTDPRDGQVYRTVQIGNQVWFAENLKYAGQENRCLMDDETNCQKYGRLYRTGVGYPRPSSFSICPSGWHVPDSMEWKELYSYVDKNNGDESVVVSLKSTTGWITEGEEANSSSAAVEGTDRFGFSVLPSGRCYSMYCYDDVTLFAVREVNGKDVTHALSFDGFSFANESGYFSVRCLKTNPVAVDQITSYRIFEDQIWMKENLTHDGSEEFTSFDAMNGVCPEPWRMPGRDELESYVSNAAVGGANECFWYSGAGLYSANSSYLCLSPAHARCVLDRHNLLAFVNGQGVDETILNDKIYGAVLVNEWPSETPETCAIAVLNCERLSGNTVVISGKEYEFDQYEVDDWGSGTGYLVVEDDVVCGGRLFTIEFPRLSNVGAPNDPRCYMHFYKREQML